MQNATPNSPHRLKSAACYQPMSFPTLMNAGKNSEEASSPSASSSLMRLTPFEMNLDVPSPPALTPTSETVKTPTSHSIFKMFASPKFARKATPTTPTTPVSPNNNLLSPPTPTKLQRALLGSPRLHRAIFGSAATSSTALGRKKQEVAAAALNRSNSRADDKTPMVMTSPVRTVPVHRPPPLVSPPSVAGSTPSAVFYGQEADSGSSCPGTPVNSRLIFIFCFI